MSLALPRLSIERVENDKVRQVTAMKSARLSSAKSPPRVTEGVRDRLHPRLRIASPSRFVRASLRTTSGPTTDLLSHFPELRSKSRADQLIRPAFVCFIVCVAVRLLNQCASRFGCPELICSFGCESRRPYHGAFCSINTCTSLTELTRRSRTGYFRSSGK